jgi:hypothetical protein
VSRISMVKTFLHVAPRLDMGREWSVCGHELSIILALKRFNRL